MYETVKVVIIAIGPCWTQSSWLCIPATAWAWAGFGLAYWVRVASTPESAKVLLQPSIHWPLTPPLPLRRFFYALLQSSRERQTHFSSTSFLLHARDDLLWPCSRRLMLCSFQTSRSSLPVVSYDVLLQDGGRYALLRRDAVHSWRLDNRIFFTMFMEVLEDK